MKPSQVPLSSLWKIPYQSVMHKSIVYLVFLLGPFSISGRHPFHFLTYGLICFRITNMLSPNQISALCKLKVCLIHIVYQWLVVTLLYVVDGKSRFQFLHFYFFFIDNLFPFLLVPFIFCLKICTDSPTPAHTQYP